MKRGLVVVFAALAACGAPSRGQSRGPGVSGTDGAPGPGGDGGTSGPGLDAGGVAPAYPAGPYGHQIGDTLPNLVLSGYRLTRTQTDSTRLPWDTNIQFADYHQPSCQCLLVTIGALWCTACQQEQPQLVSDVAGDPSFCV